MIKLTELVFFKGSNYIHDKKEVSINARHVSSVQERHRFMLGDFSVVTLLGSGKEICVKESKSAVLEMVRVALESDK